MKDKELDVGDIIEFELKGKYIPKFVCDSDLPPDMTVHGSTIPKINEGRIVGIYNEYYIVNYISDREEEVQLRFKADVLKLKEKAIEKESYSIF